MQDYSEILSARVGMLPAFGPVRRDNAQPRELESKSSQTLESTRKAWPLPSLDAERRFCQPHGRLFPFLGRKVRTPVGPGTLLQVFAERVTVLLDSELGRCSFFRPAEIEPVSWEG